MIASDSGDELARYTDATGHAPDADALALYRLTWDLGDMAAYLSLMRSPHEHTVDTEQSWRNLSRLA